MERVRNRLITAALRYAAAERGGLDGADISTELANASVELDDATIGYANELDLDKIDEES